MTTSGRAGGINAKGAVFYTGEGYDPVKTPPPADAQPDPSKMVFGAITDYILNTMGLAVYRSGDKNCQDIAGGRNFKCEGFMNTTIDAAFLDKLKNGTGKLLETTCAAPSFCIGMVVPKMGAAFPN